MFGVFPTPSHFSLSFEYSTWYSLSDSYKLPFSLVAGSQVIVNELTVPPVLEALITGSASISVTAGMSLKLSGKYIVLYCVSASFLSTASNLDALYCNPVISSMFLSVSAIAMTLNNLASFLVLPVCRAALESTHIESGSGLTVKAGDTLRLSSPFTWLSVLVSV